MQPTLLEIHPDYPLMADSPRIEVDPGMTYRLDVPIVAHQGAAHSAYIVMIALDKLGREIRRRVRWIDLYDGQPRTYTLISKPHQGAHSMLVGYRIHEQIPAGYGSDVPVSIEIPPVEEWELVPAPGEAELYDYDWLDFDMRWQRARLETDYYSIVGPSSEKLFKATGEFHFHMMRRMGLTPDAHVLDVGCGTGSLTEPLVEFLNEDGHYVGTDIAPQAIEFCKKRFPARFEFYVNESTHLPIERGSFNFITFFSIFTHTYADETRELLREARRLIAPDGCVIADIWICPTTDTSIGMRNRVEMNPDYYASLARDAGFSEITLMTGKAGMQCPFVIRP